MGKVSRRRTAAAERPRTPERLDLDDNITLKPPIIELILQDAEGESKMDWLDQDRLRQVAMNATHKRLFLERADLHPFSNECTELDLASPWSSFLWNEATSYTIERMPKKYRHLKRYISYRVFEKFESQWKLYLTFWAERVKARTYVVHRCVTAAITNVKHAAAKEAAATRTVGTEAVFVPIQAQHETDAERARRERAIRSRAERHAQSSVVQVTIPRPPPPPKTTTLVPPCDDAAQRAQRELRIASAHAHAHALEKREAARVCELEERAEYVRRAREIGGC